MKVNQRIPIALDLLEDCRAEHEISQKRLRAAGMLDGIRGEGGSRQELIIYSSLRSNVCC